MFSREMKLNEYVKNNFSFGKKKGINAIDVNL
jgi:hypothetical protein